MSLKIKLRHSPGRPSRSDFVQSEFIEAEKYYQLYQLNGVSADNSFPPSIVIACWKDNHNRSQMAGVIKSVKLPYRNTKRWMTFLTAAVSICWGVGFLYSKKFNVFSYENTTAMKYCLVMCLFSIALLIIFAISRKPFKGFVTRQRILVYNFIEVVMAIIAFLWLHQFYVYVGEWAAFWM